MITKRHSKRIEITGTDWAPTRTERGTLSHCFIRPPSRYDLSSHFFILSDEIDRGPYPILILALDCVTGDRGLFPAAAPRYLLRSKRNGCTGATLEGKREEFVKCERFKERTSRKLDVTSYRVKLPEDRARARDLGGVRAPRFGTFDTCGGSKVRLGSVWTGEWSCSRLEPAEPNEMSRRALIHSVTLYISNLYLYLYSYLHRFESRNDEQNHPAVCTRPSKKSGNTYGGEPKMLSGLSAASGTALAPTFSRHFFSPTIGRSVDRWKGGRNSAREFNLLALQ